MNSIRPSCSFDMSWSTLSFSAEKISLLSRICRPRLAIFSVTSPNSSCSDSFPESASVEPEADTVEVAADFLQRSEGEIGDSRPPAIAKRRSTRWKNKARASSAGVISFLRKTRGNADADRAERCSIQLQRKTYIVDRGRAVHQAKLLPEAGGHYRVKIWPRRNWLAYQLRIGMQKGLAIRVHRPKHRRCRAKARRRIRDYSECSYPSADIRRGRAAPLRDHWYRRACCSNPEDHSREVGELLGQPAGAFVGIGDALAKDLEM